MCIFLNTGFKKKESYSFDVTVDDVGDPYELVVWHCCTNNDFGIGTVTLKDCSSRPCKSFCFKGSGKYQKRNQKETLRNPC